MIFILFTFHEKIGIGIDGSSDSDDGVILVKKKGKVKMLEDEVKENADKLDLKGNFIKKCIS